MISFFVKGKGKLACHMYMLLYTVTYTHKAYTQFIRLSFDKGHGLHNLNDLMRGGLTNVN